jgi:hypothetical protein
MDVRTYFQDIPLIHTWDGGKTWNSGGFDRRTLEQIVSLICENFEHPRIIETGAGNSTISFLLCNPKEIISICHDQELYDRITNYCRSQTIPTKPLRTFAERSELALPRIAASGPQFDFALIDGGHGWPSVFVDFCYVNAMMKRNSIIMIDDVQLYSICELANWLSEQPDFTLVKQFPKSLAFRKNTDEPVVSDFGQQPYITRKSGVDEMGTKKETASALRRAAKFGLRIANKTLSRRKFWNAGNNLT